MNKNSVCAVVVTFRPDESVLGNLAKVRQQVEGLVVVDNGSSAEALASLRRESLQMGFTLIENGANLGIATALNIGARWARSHSYNWVALFDQDSTVTDGYIAAMLDEHSRLSQPETVAIVTPKHVDRQTEQWQAPILDKNGDPHSAITSGSLMPVQIFDKCGWFEDNLIIDLVDDEYCMRIRSQGYRIAYASGAKLFHVVGHPQDYSVLGVKFRVFHHNAQRRYYITRNSLVLALRYWRSDPRWSIGVVAYVFKQAAITLLVDNHRVKNLRYTLQAIADAFAGRLGKLVEL
jgi:rhamnosyltransferase